MKVITLVRRFLSVTVFLALISPLPAQAAPASAEGVVRDFYATLVATMKQGPQLGFKGRHQKLAPVLQASYNFPLMTRMAVGSGWAGASAKEQSDLIAAFSDYSLSTYVSRFASYDGEAFTVTGEKASGKDVIVETALKPKNEDAVTLNYLMRKDDKGAYRIIDVFMNGTISELATRRAEFSSIVRREGIPALIQSLQAKAKQMSVEKNQ